MIKELFTDYKEMVWNPQIGWIKKHWIAYLVILAISAFVGSIPFIVMKIRDKVDDIRWRRSIRKMNETNED
jgi:hypothetical protein